MAVGGRPLKVVVKSPFSRYSGYGNDGYGLLRALMDWGCDVYPQPVWVDVPIPRDLLPLFAKTLYPPFDLLVNHWDPDHIEITREARQTSRIAVAWSMWEFSGPPDHIKKPCPQHTPCLCGELRTADIHDTHVLLDGKRLGHAYKSGLRTALALGRADCTACYHVSSGLIPLARQIRRDRLRPGMRDRLKWFDLTLGYDEVSLSALQPFASPKMRTGILQGGIESKLWRPLKRDWHGERFQFLMHGALNSRKDPWVAIQAFHKLKAEKGEEFAPARLALHTIAPGTVFPELNGPFADKGIKVFVSSLDEQGVKELYASAHCLLAPSLGEGKNLPALEFQCTEGVVAATAFGGHRQWLGSDWAYPLDYTLQATLGDCPWGAHNAKVSIEHMAEVIWHIYTHRGEAELKARRAAELIPKMCDWSVVVENLFRRVRDLPGPGPQVYDKAMACRIEPEQGEFGFPS